MENIAIYTLTSPLHDERAVAKATEAFLGSLGLDCQLCGDNYADYGQHAVDLIYVRTGGTEGLFRQLLPQLRASSDRPFYLLTSGQSNSLAASMEILSYLRQHQLRGEILHGGAAYIRSRVAEIARVGEARRLLRDCRLGIIGAPSDWLISSVYDSEIIGQKLGVKLVDVPMRELLDLIGEKGESDPSERILLALREVVAKYQLQGFTLRCFDLLKTIRYTSCLALAQLNAEGLIAGCEGDVPAMLSMMIVRALTGVSGFQANPASIDVEGGTALFAHCTIPLDMVERYELDTHFESGIGVGIRGYMKEGPVTVFKVSGDLSRHFVAEGQLVENQSKPDLCRTQQLIRFDDSSQLRYFLTEPIGNHHIIVPGHVRGLLEEILQ